MANRLTISSTGSTSSMSTGGRVPPLNRKSPRRVMSLCACSSTARVYSLKISYRPCRVECWSLNTVVGLNRCSSPSRRHWYSPPISSARCAARISSDGNARRWRVSTSSASTSKPTPPSREVVPVKQVSITSAPRPTASKICAPV